MIPYQAAFKAVSLEQLTALNSRIEIVCAVVVSQVGAVVMILVGGIVIILLRRVVVSVVLLIVLAAVYQRPAHEFIKLHIIVKRINGCYWLKSLPLFLMHEFGRGLTRCLASWTAALPHVAFSLAGTVWWLAYR